MRYFVGDPCRPRSQAFHRERPGRSSEDLLDYLHQHWALPDGVDPSLAAGSLEGRLVGLFGRMTFKVLGPYLREERELLAHMVRCNDALERRCNELAVRCQELNQDMADRQVAEAENQAKLALWLHLEPPPGAAIIDDAVSPHEDTSDGVSR